MTQTERSIPAHSVGVGLKPSHYKEALARPAGVDFFEVHAENFMGAGGPPHAWLSAIREQFPITVHGVSLSLAGLDPLSKDHLARLKTVVDRYNPAIVSEHLAWCVYNGTYYHDLLAPPITKETFCRLCDNVDQTQNVLGRRILIENPSQYLNSGAEIPLPEVLNELVRHTGCGILFDVNNAYVSACNLNFDAEAFVDSIDSEHVGEIHLAGHALDHLDGYDIRVDNHGSPVCNEVSALYKRFIARSGPKPTLIEWDTDVPDFTILLEEAARASAWMKDAGAMGEHKRVTGNV